MDISIIIPIYKAEKWLDRCLQSILKIEWDDLIYEIILIDDGSPDNSGVIADKYAQSYNNIKVFHQENQGQSISRNNGLMVATGKYVWWVDADDYVLPEAASMFIRRGLELDLDVYCAQMEIGDINGKLGKGSVQPFSADIIMSGAESLYGGLTLASACANIYRRKFLINNDLKFYPGIIHEDTEFNTRVFSAAKKVAFYPIPVYFYFKTGCSSSTGFSLEKQKRLLYDGAFIALKCLHLSESIGNSDVKLRDFLHIRANSMIVGSLYHIMRDRSYSIALIREYINQLAKDGLYPLQGKAQTLASTLLKNLFNCRRIYFLFCHISRL